MSRATLPLSALASAPASSRDTGEESATGPTDADADSLDALDDSPGEPDDTEGEDEPAGDNGTPTRPYTGLGLYDAHTEALTW
ncbi:hypothetical protein ACIQU4_42295 [Streptomyces sp. NPDC090741]|uniref:hypothetical protein n=1 Tax=Streptomyces sp. NPDC090741 TaxID=3365967 RepID=UPI0038020CC6